MKKVLIYTDGSCLGNPGPGGWAAILKLYGSTYERELGGGFRLTTNNRMEIMAALQGLAALKEACEVELYTDSQYLRNAVEKGWLEQWQSAGWRKKDKKPVLNVDLWQKFLPLMRAHKLTLHWLKGHCGHAENERCDSLARAYAQNDNLPEDEVFEALQEKGAAHQ